MWRVVLLFCLISFVVVPILIQQVNQRPADSHVAMAAMVAHPADQSMDKPSLTQGPERRSDFVADRMESMAQVSLPVNVSSSLASVSGGVISVNPFRRKIMADVFFDTSSSSLNLSRNHSNTSSHNSTSAPMANTTVIDLASVAQVNVTRVKDLRPPPPPITTPAAPSVTTAVPATTSPVSSPTPSTTKTSGMPLTTASTTVTTTSRATTPTVATWSNGSLKLEPSDPDESRRRKAILSRFLLDSKEKGLNASSAECQLQLDRTDACFRTVMLVDGKFPVPKTFADLDSGFCANSTTTLKCLGGYSKCLNKIPRILYHFLYLQVKRIMNNICRVESFREDILFHARCFRDPQDLRLVREIVDRGTITSLYVLRHVATRNIIPWGCCGFQKMWDEGRRQLDALCLNRTGNQTGEFVMNFMRSAASDLLDMGCRRYNSMDMCNQNLPEAMIVFNELTASQVPPQKYSPIIPLVEISRRMAGSGE